MSRWRLDGLCSLSKYCRRCAYLGLESPRWLSRRSRRCTYLGLESPRWLSRYCRRCACLGLESLRWLSRRSRRCAYLGLESPRWLDRPGLVAVLTSLRSLFRETRCTRLSTFASLRSAHRRPGWIEPAAPFSPPKRATHLPSRFARSLRSLAHPSHGVGLRPSQMLGHARKRAPTPRSGWRGENTERDYVETHRRTGRYQ